MDTSNTGGGSGSGSGSNASPRQKPDISAGLVQLKASLQAWKQLIDEGKVESLVLKIESPPELAGIPNRMLTEPELQQLMLSKKMQSDYMQRIRKTPRLD